MRERERGSTSFSLPNSIYLALAFDRTAVVVLVKFAFKVDNRYRAAYKMSIIEPVSKTVFILFTLQSELVGAMALE